MYFKCILVSGSPEDGFHGGHLNLGKNTNVHLYGNHWLGSEGAVTGQSRYEVTVWGGSQGTNTFSKAGLSQQHYLDGN